MTVAASLDLSPNEITTYITRVHEEAIINRIWTLSCMEGDIQTRLLC